MIRLIIRTHGSKWWLCDNQFHRVNGPAITRHNGSVEYWINDRLVSEYEHMFLTTGTYD